WSRFRVHPPGVPCAVEFDAFGHLRSARGARVHDYRKSTLLLEFPAQLTRGMTSAKRQAEHGISMANSRIERVLRHDGILAVLDWYTDPAHAGAQPQWAGDEAWRSVVLEAVKLRKTADQPSVRVLIGDHAVLVSGDEKHV